MNTQPELMQHIRHRFNHTTAVITQEEIIDCETLIDQYHQSNPLDEDLLICEALLLMTSPLVDYPKALELLSKIAKARSILLQASIQLRVQGFIEPEQVQQLSAGVPLTNKRYQSMAAFLLAENIWWQHRTSEQAYQLYTQAVQLDPSTVLAYLRLADIHLAQGHMLEFAQCTQKGLVNVKEIWNMNDPLDYADFDAYANEALRGTHPSDSNYSSWKDFAMQHGVEVPPPNQHCK